MFVRVQPSRELLSSEITKILIESSFDTLNRAPRKVEFIARLSAEVLAR
jgi:hypothetical protein